MALIFATLFFSLLCAATFLPSARLLYARNPPFMGMVLTLCACFLGVYGALEFSRAQERQDRMARAATLMEMAREALGAERVEARLLARLAPATGSAPGDTAAESAPPAIGSRPVSASPKELGDLLNNGAVLEQISPQSLKALLACQADMQRDLQAFAAGRGRERRHRLNAYLRQLGFAQGVLAAEAEFQRGRIGRSDLEEILREWSLRMAAPQMGTL
jgi:hypothetical protein